MPDISSFTPLWGAWEIVRPLGSGSFGDVYEVKRNDTGREYSAAVKHISIPPKGTNYQTLQAEGSVTDEASARRYCRGLLDKLIKEIDICYELKGHTNFVSYEDHVIIPRQGELGYDVFIRMELLTALPDRVSRKGVTVGTIIKLCEDMCTALSVLEQKKIIHRDIKPANIFVSAAGDFKLGDFGVARHMEGIGNMSVKGTYNFMAPEILRGGTAGHAADIYSLGLVLYRLLNNNRAPFLPAPPAEIVFDDNEKALEKRLSGVELPMPARADLSLPLTNVIMRACDFEPEKRFKTADEMKNTLTDYLRATYRAKQNIDLDSTVAVERSSAASVLPGSLALPPSFVGSGGGSVYPPGGGYPVGVKRSPDKSAVNTKVIIAASASAVVLTVALIAIFMINRPPAPPADASPVASTTQEPPPATTPTSKPAAEHSEEWSVWMTALPINVTDKDFEIESMTFYRSAPLLQSDTPEIEDPEYTLCYTLYGNYGEWSGWSGAVIEESDLLEVESRTQYRYRELLASVTSQPGKMYTITSYYWSDWISGYKAPVSGQVEVTGYKQYRSREKEIIYCFYREKDWSEFTETPVNPSDTLVVNTMPVYRFMPRDRFAQIPASMNNFPLPPDDWTGRFADVDDNRWFGGLNSGYVGVAAQIGAIVPDEFMLFRPTENINVGEVITAAAVLSRLYSGLPGFIPGADGEYAAYAEYAVKNNLISSGDFSDYTVAASRQQVAYILSLALPEAELSGVNSVSSVTDMDAGSKYYQSVIRLARAGIIEWPTPDYFFNGEESMTRAEASALITRLVIPEERRVNT